MSLPRQPVIKRARRFGKCVKWVFGAALCGAGAYVCIEPFLKRHATSDSHHMGIGEWVLALLVIPVILLTALACVVSAVFCLILAFRSLRAGEEFY